MLERITFTGAPSWPNPHVRKKPPMPLNWRPVITGGAPAVCRKSSRSAMVHTKGLNSRRSNSPSPNQRKNGFAGASAQKIRHFATECINRFSQNGLPSPDYRSVACHFYVLKLRSQSDVYGFREFFRMYQGKHPDNHSWDPSCHSLCMPDMMLAVGGGSCSMAISVFRKSRIADPGIFWFWRYGRMVL